MAPYALPLAPKTDISGPPSRTRLDATATKPGVSPLDIEGPLHTRDGGGGGGGGPPDASLDKKIDRHLLPCLCAISIANYLGERKRVAWMW